MTDTDNFLIAESQLLLDKSRREKAERIKDLGTPIRLAGKALAILVSDGNAWVGENTTVAKKLDLESGKILQIYHGHTGPVSALALFQDSNQQQILVTGSWDKTIKLWDTKTKELLSSTDAHSDFVKSFIVFSPSKLLISGSSDKTIRFWDLSSTNNLSGSGSISSHTRPVECLDGRILTDGSIELCTGDTMGIIRLWKITKDGSRWISKLQAEFNHHRTRINDLRLGAEDLWTASSDDTAQILTRSAHANPTALAHPAAVRTILPLTTTGLAEPYLITGAGDVIRTYDLSSPEEPELIREQDAHWHDVTALRLWYRKFVGDDDKPRVETMIISTSLDGTIRKWKLSDLLQPSLLPPPSESHAPIRSNLAFEMSEEEERELAELLDSD